MTDILKELLLAILITMSCSLVAEPKAPPDDRPYAVVLGIAQDGGYPHAGCVKLCCKDLWDNKTIYREKVSSIAIIDPRTRLAWIIDATPDFHEQLHTVTQKHSARLAGIFITHAHIGHYTGLMHLGREVMGAKNITVYAMPRMKRFLEKNGPWNQLVELNNIQLDPIKDQKEIILGKQLIIAPFRVPHRAEYSETGGFTIIGPNESMIYIPDIDKWDRWEHNISLWIEQHSYALLDGTFYSIGELPDRSMDEIPHPFILESIHHFMDLLDRDRRKIYFIHFNHTNPAIQKISAVTKSIIKEGYNTAREGMIFPF